MKQFILTFALSLAAFAPSMAEENGNDISEGKTDIPTEKSDTIYSYNIDGQHIKHFTGKELEGKTIKQYDILHAFVPEDNVVIETHMIKTTTPSKSRPLEPHYILDGKEITKNELDNIKPSKIESISVLKAGSKAALEYGKDGDIRSYIVIKLKK